MNSNRLTKNYIISLVSIPQEEASYGSGIKMILFTVFPMFLDFSTFIQTHKVGNNGINVSIGEIRCQ